MSRLGQLVLVLIGFVILIAAGRAFGAELKVPRLHRPVVTAPGPVAMPPTAPSFNLRWPAPNPPSR